MAHGMTRRLKKLINAEADLLTRAAQKATDAVNVKDAYVEDMRGDLIDLIEDLEGIRDSLLAITGGKFDSR